MVSRANLLDTRMGARLSRFYEVAATIQQAVKTRDAAGGEVRTWADDPSQTDLPARLWPTKGPGELERPDQVLTMATHRLAFRGTDAEVSTDQRLRVGAALYDILLVETDSEDHATYLDLEVVT